MGMEEIVVPFPAPPHLLAPATQVRSTLIASSLQSLRSRGLADAYVETVDAQWRDTLVQAVAGTWLPIAAGVAHYTACNTLVSLPMDQMAIGREVGDRLHGTFLGTMIRAAKGVGVTPWLAFSRTRFFYEHIFDGGGCCVTKLGPKDARMEMVGNPLANIPYFRNATRGLWLVAIEMFCTKAYMLETDRGQSSYGVKISWA